MYKNRNLLSFIERLKSISETSSDSLEKAVALEALGHETHEGILWFFNDLLQHGCICVMVTSMVYYCNTEAFFNKYYEDIIWLKTEYEESTWKSMENSHQVKDYLDWFAFKETTRQNADELSLN